MVPHLEAEEILTYIKSSRNGSVCYFSSKLDVLSNVVRNKRVARILFSKIRPSREILKIRDGTPLEAEEILTYIKKPSKRIVKKRVAGILFSKIRPSREILKMRDGTPFGGGGNFDIHKKALETDRKEWHGFCFPKLGHLEKFSKFVMVPHLEAEEILTYIKSSRNGSVCYFSSKLDVPSNVVRNKRVARILFSKIRPSREILKIRDGTPLEAEEILTYIKKPTKWIDVPCNKKRVARILFSKIRPSREILKIRDGTPLEAEEILTYIKSPRNGSKKRVARILFSKIRPSREILKIRDGTPLEAEEILTYIKKPSKRIEPSREILKIRDGTPFGGGGNFDIHKRLSKRIVAQILFSKIRPSREMLKIRDGTPLEAEEILTYIKSSRNGSVFYFSSKLDIPSNVVQKKRVARILFSKIRPSREILKIRDGTPLEAEEILTYIKKPSKRIGLLLF
ncbi:hypothetical protein OROHE_005986 [Orobanche hederae]